MRRTGYMKSNPKRLGGLLGASLDDMGLTQKILEHQALAKWGEVVGTQIAASTIAERVRDGIMFVCCKSSMWSNELTMHKSDIIKRLNKSVGKNIITDIRFSARGFRKVLEQAQKEQTDTRVRNLEKVEVDESANESAAKVAAQVDDVNLAKRIEKAVLSSKRLSEVKRQEGWIDCPKCGALFNGEHKVCDNCR